MNIRCPTLIISVLFAATGGWAVASDAPAVGTIEGRILNPRNGEYVENARITVEGTLLQTFSDQLGAFRLTQVPAGNVRVKVFFTGFGEQALDVVVAPGATIRRDVSLGAPADSDQTGEIVKLSQYVVEASREMSGAAISINEQRFAPNLKTVVAADEFGSVQEDDLGEFLKFVPGMTINYVGGDVRTISMNGVPADYVPVTVGGFSLASAGATATSRQVELNNISMNNIARVEAIYTPTPESPGSALAGSVNVVPRSAFDRAKPLLTWSAAMVMRDNDRHFSKTPGPLHEPTRKVHPSVNVSYVMPVNDRFGFTVSAGTITTYMPQDFLINRWRSASDATNGNAFPDTTPDLPYLTGFEVRDGTKQVERHSFATTIDYKLGPNDRLSLAFNYGYTDLQFINRTLAFSITRVAPGSFSPTFTHGSPGAGDISQSFGGRSKSGTTYMPTLTYRHNGPLWRMEAGTGFSRSTNHNRDFERGTGALVRSVRSNVTINFDDIFYLRPNSITVTDGATGAPVDPYAISTYSLDAMRYAPLDIVDLRRSAFAWAQRDFSLGRTPLTLKAGLDVQQAMRDSRGPLVNYTAVGADGVARTADDNAAQILDEDFSRPGPFGFPFIQWMDSYKAVQLIRQHQEYFTYSDAAEYTGTVQRSFHAEETVSSAYLRFDTHFFERRLKLVGGIRAEQTNVKGQGRLIDNTRNYRRDASGNVLRNPNGTPQLLNPANTLAAVMLTNVDRGLRAEKEYLRWFPSLNASFNIRDNLIARAGYYWSIGRPSFLQYAGSLTLPDTDLPPATNNRITVNNAGIKAWSATTTKVALEYYFKGVGILSVGVFRRDIENFFGTAVFQATPEFLSLYNLDAGTYGDFDVSTERNLPDPVRMQGVDVNYKQALTFLPHWARGVQVFANMSAQRTSGTTDAFTAFRQGFVPRSYNWGVSLTRERYNLRANWSYRGRQRRAALSGRSIEPGTFEWGSKQLKIDLAGEYWLSRRYALFANLANIHDAPDDTERRGPSTPDHAHLRVRERYGSLWTFGIKGSY